jgi:hypothetical protein
MLRMLTPFLLLVPLAARAQSAWQDDGQWAGDDQYSSEPGNGADARDDGYAAQEQYENPPPPPDEEYGAGQYATAPAPVDDYAAGPSMDDFRSGLRPYGRWIVTSEYGRVWQPRHVGRQWQPYWDGRWVWTTAGWTWVTDEPWGWATYHYGRWAFVDGAGWVWLPGRVWAPAWVAWRWGGGYAGWCPLGPRGVVYVHPRRWVFVQTPNFLAPVRHHTVSINVVTTVWTRAQPLPVVRPTPRAGPQPRIVEEHTRVPVRAVPIVEAPSRNATRPLTTGAVPVWRPRTVPYLRPVAPATRAEAAPARAEPPRVTPGGTVVRGGPRAIPVEQRPSAERQRPVEQRRPAEQRQSLDRVMPVQRPRPVEEAPQREQTPRAEQRPRPVEEAPQREQTPRAEQRPAPAQPVRPTPPAAEPARRAEHEGPARPAAEPHPREIQAARDREKN